MGTGCSCFPRWFHAKEKWDLVCKEFSVSGTQHALLKWLWLFQGSVHQMTATHWGLLESPIEKEPLVVWKLNKTGPYSGSELKRLASSEKTSFSWQVGEIWLPCSLHRLICWGNCPSSCVYHITNTFYSPSYVGGCPRNSMYSWKDKWAFPFLLEGATSPLASISPVDWKEFSIALGYKM